MEIPKSESAFPHILRRKNTSEPESKDCTIETMKNGVKRVPDMSEAAADFTRQSSRNEEKSKPDAARITALESPSLKKGVNLGRADSAYEKSRANAPRYERRSFFSCVTWLFQS